MVERNPTVAWEGLGRVRLSVPAAPFVSLGGCLTRITFAIVDGGEPVVFAAPCRTVVVVWPCDPRGYVDVEAVYAGRTRTAVWELAEREVAGLRNLLSEGWTFDDVDLLVGGGVSAPRLIPASRSLRECEHYPRIDPGEMERQVRGSASKGDPTPP